MRAQLCRKGSKLLPHGSARAARRGSDGDTGPLERPRRGKANRTIRRVAAMVVVVPHVPFHLRRPARRPPYCSCLACAPLSFLSRRWHGGRLLSLPSPPPHPPLGSFPTPPDNRRARPKGGACTGACRASHDALACCQPLARPRTPGTSLSPRPLGCPVGQPPEPAFPLPTPHRSIVPPSVGHLPLPPWSGLLTLLRPFVPSAPSWHA